MSEQQQQASMQASMNLKVEAAGFSAWSATPGTANEDAFITRHVVDVGTGFEFTYGAVFDGAGRAAGLAHRLCLWLEQAARGITPGMLQDPVFLRALVRRLDMQAGLSGKQAAAVLTFVHGSRAWVAALGDCSAVLMRRVEDASGELSHNDTGLLMAPPQCRARLGTGEARAMIWEVTLNHGDALCLISDGCKGLGIGGIANAIRRRTLNRVEEAAEAVIGDLVRRRMQMDDATALVMRCLRPAPPAPPAAG